MVFLESQARLLLFAHLVAAVIALGSTLHLGWRLWQRSRRHDEPSSTVSLHATILLWAYGAAFALGALLYPTFRVRVRATLFDPLLPWATGLFELKEHLASVGLVAVVALALLLRSRRGDETQADRVAAERLFIWGLWGVLLSILLYSAWSGWYLGTLHRRPAPAAATSKVSPRLERCSTLADATSDPCQRLLRRTACRRPHGRRV